MTAEKQIYVGQTCQFEKQVSDEDVKSFAKVTGDYNPIHMDDAYAAQTRFKGRIAHGMIGAGIISGGLSMHLPGEGTVYLGQELTFKNPVRIGETLTVHFEVIEIIPKKNFDIARIKTTCTNSQGEVVIDGVASVIPPSLT